MSISQIKILVISCLVLTTSCVSKKNITYFQNDLVDQSKVSNSYKTVYKPDDLLQINISSIDMEAVMPFNLSSSASTEMTSSKPQTYLIDSNGEIDFPILGKLTVGGLSREDAVKLFKDKLDPTYVKSPSININITNFKVTVLGDVSKPGNFTIPNERITILEAIGLAGDLNLSGQRQNILVTREEGEKKVFYTLDLLSNNLFTSPAYYLQQNDVVYVDQNYAKSQDAATNQSTRLIFSTTSIILALINILTRN